MYLISLTGSTTIITQQINTDKSDQLCSETRKGKECVNLPISC